MPGIVFLDIYVCPISTPGESITQIWLQYRYIKKKKIEYHEKGQYFLPLISEIETHILIDSLHME